MGADEDVAGGGALSDTVSAGGRISRRGSEGEAEQLTLGVGGVTSKSLASNHGWQRVQGRVLWVSEQKCGSF